MRFGMILAALAGNWPHDTLFQKVMRHIILWVYEVSRTYSACSVHVLDLHTSCTSSRSKRRIIFPLRKLAECMLYLYNLCIYMLYICSLDPLA